MESTPFGMVVFGSALALVSAAIWLLQPNGSKSYLVVLVGFAAGCSFTVAGIRWAARVSSEQRKNLAERSRLYRLAFWPFRDLGTPEKDEDTQQ